MTAVRILPVSGSAVLAEYDDLVAALDAFEILDSTRPAGIRALVPAARTVLVEYRPERLARDEVVGWLRTATATGRAAAADEIVTIPVRYDGPDLAEVAELLGLSIDEVVNRHTAGRYRVAFTGFAPGFGYLSGGHPSLDVPRRASPRTRVPEGSVGLAGEFSGVYPKTAPGGWQLIGTTEERMWDLDRTPPALFRPGVGVRFTVAERPRIDVTPAGETGAAGTPPASTRTAGPALEAVDAGLQTLVQDLGRPGHTDEGVGSAGAADRIAFRDANRLVGNPPDAAALELAAAGGSFRARGPLVVAVTGAQAAIGVAPRTDRRRLEGVDRAIALDDGDVLEIGPAVRGFRSYLAVRGGIDAPLVLGSRSRDTLAELGPDPVRIGDTIAVAPAHGPATAVGDPSSPRPLPAAGDVVGLDVVLGPRTDWFDDESLTTFTEQEWLVSPRSDRVGVRLSGERALTRSRSDELPSEGTIAGAIQVPSDGNPVLFLADHPLTGGYPVIAAVADHHLDLAGQLAPGVRIRFTPIGPFRAEASTDDE